MPMTAHDDRNVRIDPVGLSKLLGQKFPPTPQQAEVISAPLTSVLVVAGAGAGKTETMAARVVWLVANGFIKPEEVLGLTFTRKASQQLGQRIRDRLGELAKVPELNELDPTGELEKTLEVVAPQSSTYDAFVGNVLREFGLLLPMDPGGRVVSNTEMYQRASRIVAEFQGTLTTDNKLDSVTNKVLALASELDNHMVSPEELTDETHALLAEFQNFHEEKALTIPQKKIWNIQKLRLELLPLVKALKDELKENNLVTFGEQTSQAARLAEKNPLVGKVLRSRFKVVLLDEYQDTSHAQRVLLRSLFNSAAVTAVGDPMQAIYGWRGATSTNLDRFVDDYQRDGMPAEKKELTISFRNPPEVLNLANKVSSTVLGSPNDPKRPVSPLDPRPGAPAGEVQLGFFHTVEDELNFVADELADAYDKRDLSDEPFTAAVLVRTNAASAPIANALRDRGVPVEIVGLTGLLNTPEVQDLIAIATMLIRPQDDEQTMRIIAGPKVGLGLNDIKALSKRAETLAKRASKAATSDNNEKAQLDDAEEHSDPDNHAMAKLHAIVEDQLSTDPDNVVGLADAIADLGEPEQYSAEGYARLQELSAMLRRLRTRSLGNSLSDLFADIEREFTIRTEVLVREDPKTDGAVGTIQLERFAEEVASYAQIPNATLGGLLDFFTVAQKQDKGLQPGEVQVRADRVQILTAHKAKGLEWRIVSVLHADSGVYKGKSDSWMSNVEMVPSTLRGDAAEDEDMAGTPVLDLSHVENRKEFGDALTAHKEEHKRSSEEESARLFYVAITRSEHRLLVTASAFKPNRKNAVAPYSNFEILKKAMPEAVVYWWDPLAELETENHEATPDQADSKDKTETHQSANPLGQPEAEDITAWYPPTVDLRGIDDVRAALHELPEFSASHEIFTTWEKEVTALIEEHKASKAPVVEVEITRELTASDMVAMKRSPEEFAKRLRRPVPFKPNSFAKRGTAFHLWLEDRFGATALLDEDELPGFGEEETATAEQLETLKQAFLESEWADKTPAHVEQAFEFSIGPAIIRGRMDAVFDNGDGTWQVIDWKTGHLPTKAQMESTRLQLAVYRLAWAKLKKIDPEKVDAAFYYIADKKLIAPKDLPDYAELEEMIVEVHNIEGVELS